MKQPKSFSNLKEQEREARRKIILSAAEKVFASKPLSKVRMCDIANEASISTALIYRYFPDQQSLFVEAFLGSTSRIIEILDSFLAQSEYDREGIYRFIDNFIDYLTSNDYYFKMLVNFMLDGNLKPELLDKIIEIEHRIFAQFDAVLRRIKPEGPVRMYSHGLFCALNGILLAFRNNPDKSSKEVVRYMKSLGRLIGEMFVESIESGK
ncbi:MAG TPA: TetR/AcrR family transcriptional regulator [Spirochaetota bacterium]|nr:TetR/AcrR family transcriptional regulator [Spirochaetota bacterium]HOD14739.1 TetR/AcrR family transcriptional regulator [Spirochaetota bacterium]HPG49890.1 TetR/AcrR family transcriptional regulator [Spirochaetota bacterium]HPN11515.1 TetR/AcrR family transcriptional regulator [Spirochaetota bacterium]HQL82206.1 TetR/AcrR family transcriptional regulator [Spirochaetota bacterium]